jgi:hypothetical protein
MHDFNPGFYFWANVKLSAFKDFVIKLINSYYKTTPQLLKLKRLTYKTNQLRTTNIEKSFGSAVEL